MTNNDKKSEQTKKQTGHKGKVVCFICGEKGHISRYYPENKNAKKKTNDKINMVYMNASCGMIVMNNDNWIIDSGVTHHMTPNENF